MFYSGLKLDNEIKEGSPSEWAEGVFSINNMSRPLPAIKKHVLFIQYQRLCPIFIKSLWYDIFLSLNK